VLLLGMVSYPSINFGDGIESDLNSNYLISAFAEEDDKNEDKQDDEAKDNEETDEDETEDDEKDDDVETKGNNLEDANDAIADAEKEVTRAQEKIAEAKENKKDTFASEIALEEAQDKLKEAKENFELGLYGIAEELADEAEDLASDARMSLLGKGVEDIEDELDDETEDELDDEDIEDEGETEIEVEVKNDKAKVKIELNGKEYRFVVPDVSESVIIDAIMNKTGLTEDEIRATWDFETEDGTEDDEDSDKNELRTSEKIMKHENKAQENADQIILQLQQKIDQLEQRLQGLLDKFETGEYYGTVTNADTMPDSYGISFNGLATSLSDDLVSDVDGNIYLESMTTGTDSFKLRITGGEILVGDTFYDFVFGKARLSSSDGNTTMIILGQVMDEQGNVSTIRLALDTATALTGDFGTEPVLFDIDSSRSKIAKQWTLDASGDFALLS
jgi:hypothetical protein